jgi:hypothetical protein
MRAIIHPLARPITLQEFSHEPGAEHLSDTPEIADEPAATTPAPGSMSGALRLGWGWSLPLTVKRLLLVDLKGIDTKANDEAVSLLNHEIAVIVVKRSNPAIKEALLPEYSSKGKL